MSDEWQARRDRAARFNKTLDASERETAQRIASRNTTRELGERPDYGTKRPGPWAYDLTPTEHKALNAWDRKHEWEWILAMERLMEARAKVAPAPEPAWAEGRE